MTGLSRFHVAGGAGTLVDGTVTSEGIRIWVEAPASPGGAARLGACGAAFPSLDLDGPFVRMLQDPESLSVVSLSPGEPGGASSVRVSRELLWNAVRSHPGYRGQPGAVASVDWQAIQDSLPEGKREAIREREAMVEQANLTSRTITAVVERLEERPMEPGVPAGPA